MRSMRPYQVLSLEVASNKIEYIKKFDKKITQSDGPLHQLKHVCQLEELAAIIPEISTGEMEILEEEELEICLARKTKICY